MRGARGRVLQPVRDRGIIPRGCGEHLMARLAMLSSVGSSPRMRGAPLLGTAGPLPGGIIPADAGSTDGAVWQCGRVRDHPRGLSGIIPADAGSTSAGRTGPGGSRDHPRGCGEHITVGIMDSCPQGSSPRMRGALQRRRHRRPEGGIIPADAGSTAPRTAPARRAGDHPRGCGEHMLMGSLTYPSPGPSPRMRGAQTTGLRADEGYGIIHADAGST